MLLAADLRQAARYPIVEPRRPGNFQSRPDIKALGTAGGIDYLDVTYVHPLTQSLLKSSLETIVNKTHQYKVSVHSGFMERAGPRCQAPSYPAPGGWSPSSHMFVTTVADEAASRLCVSRSVARAMTFERYVPLAVHMDA